MDMSVSKRRERVKDRECCLPWGCKGWVTTEQLNNNSVDPDPSNQLKSETHIWRVGGASQKRHAGPPKANPGCWARRRWRSRPLQPRTSGVQYAVSRKSDSGPALSSVHAHGQSPSSCDLQPVGEVGKGRLRAETVRAGLQRGQSLQKQAACWAKDSSEAPDEQRTTHAQRQTSIFHRTVSFEK